MIIHVPWPRFMTEQQEERQLKVLKSTTYRMCDLRLCNHPGPSVCHCTLRNALENSSRNTQFLTEHITRPGHYSKLFTCIFSHLIFTSIQEVGSCIILILHLRDLRHLEVKNCASGHTETRRGARIHSQESGFPA